MGASFPNYSFHGGVNNESDKELKSVNGRKASSKKLLTSREMEALSKADQRKL